MSDLFVGKWQLRETNYENGQPPREGMYSIETERNGYQVTMDWITIDGEPMRREYFAVPNGEPYPLRTPEVEGGSMSMTRVDERTLDSVVTLNNKIVSHARRVLSEDGNIMTVIQSTSTPDGNTFQNVSVYARMPD
jgi:hypothetical protein